MLAYRRLWIAGALLLSILYCAMPVIYTYFENGGPVRILWKSIISDHAKLWFDLHYNAHK